jgi:hypothetical protein
VIVMCPRPATHTHNPRHTNWYEAVGLLGDFVAWAWACLRLLVCSASDSSPARSSSSPARDAGGATAGDASDCYGPLTRAPIKRWSLRSPNLPLTPSGPQPAVHTHFPPAAVHPSSGAPRAAPSLPRPHSCHLPRRTSASLVSHRCAEAGGKQAGSAARHQPPSQKRPPLPFHWAGPSLCLSPCRHRPPGRARFHCRSRSPGCLSCPHDRGGHPAQRSSGQP